MSEKLPKSERVCSKNRIDTLFNNGKRGEVFPLKYICLETAKEGEDREGTLSMMVSVPKKVFKRAWKRNLVKRRVRESYRRRKHILADRFDSLGRHLDIAFVCVPLFEIPDYKTIDDAVGRILEQILARS